MAKIWRRLHSLNRSLGLPALLSPKLGDIDAPEICLNVAKHLVGYCQSLMIFSGYRAKTFESVFCRHFSRRKAYWYNVGKLPSSRIDAAVMFPSARFSRTTRERREKMSSRNAAVTMVWPGMELSC